MAFESSAKDAAVETLVETGSEDASLEAVATFPDAVVTDRFL